MDEFIKTKLLHLNKDDLLIHLGDVGYFDFTELKCPTVLLKVNYDKDIDHTYNPTYLIEKSNMCHVRW